jgi:hypothetical protein
MLQKAVGDVNELAYVNQIGDQAITRSYSLFDVNSYLDMLLLAYSTKHNSHATSMKHK